MFLRKVFNSVASVSKIFVFNKTEQITSISASGFCLFFCCVWFLRVLSVAWQSR